MSTNNDDPNGQGNGGNNGGNANDDPNKAKPGTLTPEQQAAVDAAVAEALKPIKQKLDGAYGQRDEALRKLAEKERADQEAEAKRLEAEGKKAEAAELRLAQEKAARETAEAELKNVKRDNVVRSAFAGQEFRSARAQESAIKEVIDTLSQNDKGEWVTKDGKTIQEAVNAFAADEDNSYLFKPKPSSGGGSSNNKPSGDGGSSKSLFSLSQAELLARAEAGTLRKKR